MYQVMLVASMLLGGMTQTGCAEVDPAPSQGASQAVVEEAFSLQIDADDLSLLTIAARAGNIRIAGVAGNDVVQIEGVKRVVASTRSRAEAALAALDLETTTAGGHSRLETVQPADGLRYEIDLTLTIPPLLDLTITSDRGEIDVKGVGGELLVDSNKGNVTLCDVEGDITLTMRQGNAVVLAELALLGEVDVVVDRGDVTLFVPFDTSAELSASTGDGDIRVLDLPLTDMTSDDGSLTGTLGEGTGRIGLSTNTGDIGVAGFFY